MNEGFEVMSFGAGGASEWEGERGARGGGRGPGPRPGPRPGRGRYFPRYYPRYYPITGGGPWWSYPLPLPTPEPLAPPDWPPPGAAPDDGMEGELPPKFREALARLPAAQRPVYTPIGTLEAAPNVRGIARPALYLIVFRGRDGSIKAYHGQTDDLRVRLLKHRLCARMLDVDARNHQVYRADTPPGGGAEKQRRRQVEMNIHRMLLPPPVGQGPRGARLLTNQRLELELQLLGET